MIKGSGYEFDAEYIGGPADGLIDTVINTKNEPPEQIFRLAKDLKPKKLGQKLIDSWKNYDPEAKIMVYKFRKIDENEFCLYDFMKFTKFGVHYDEYLKKNQ